MSSRVNLSNFSNHKKYSPWDQDRQVYQDCLVFLANPVRENRYFLIRWSDEGVIWNATEDDQFSALQKTLIHS